MIIVSDKHSLCVKYDMHGMLPWGGRPLQYTHCMISVETYEAPRDSRHGTLLPCLQGIEWQVAFSLQHSYTSTCSSAQHSYMLAFPPRGHRFPPCLLTVWDIGLKKQRRL